MKKKQTYYRTVALLSAQPQRVAAWTAPKRTVSIRIPWKWVLLSLFIVGIGIWLSQADAWYLMLGDVRVAGTTSRSLGVRALEASDILGYHRFFVRTGAAEARILDKLIEVTDARIECELYPASCIIRVVERQPVLVWVTQTGTFWVDEQGVIFPAISERLELPRVYGALPVQQQTAVVVSVLGGVRALLDLGVPAQALEYTPQQGLIWTDSAGRRVAFGVSGDMLPRMKVYEFVVGYLGGRGISPQAVDVRFPEGPTYSIERSW